MEVSDKGDWIMVINHFECSLRVQDCRLMQELQQALYTDLGHCQLQTTSPWRPKTLLKLPLKVGQF
jgi:hypothetical protein